MQTEYRNGCENPETLEAYNKIAKAKHIYAYTMLVDEELGEVVEFSFNLHGDTFHAQVSPVTCVVTLIMEFDMKGSDGSRETYTDLYGYAELDNLLSLLEKIPHIDDVLIDMGDGERVH